MLQRFIKSGPNASANRAIWTISNSGFARRTLVGLLLCVPILFTLSLAAENFSQDGLKIKVTRAKEPAVVAGYSLFQVVAENATAQDRTLHAVIKLTWLDPKKPDSPPKSEAVCVAYLEIPAGHRLTEAVPCKGAEFSNYTFEIKSVLPFVLDRTPLKWQKAESLK